MKMRYSVLLCTCVLLGCKERQFARSTANDSGSSEAETWTKIDLTRTDGFFRIVNANINVVEGAIQVNSLPHPGLFELDGNRQQGCDLCSGVFFNGDFDNGVIEVDLKGNKLPDSSPADKGFVGVTFHLNSKSRHWETVYFRPLNAYPEGNPDNMKSVQYHMFPGPSWYELRGGVLEVTTTEVVDKTPPDLDTTIGSKLYESNTPGVEPGKWFTARIVVNGSLVTTFIRTNPAGKFRQVLKVDKSPLVKKGDEPFGREIGLVSEPGNEAAFRNFRLIHLRPNEANKWLDNE